MGGGGVEVWVEEGWRCGWRRGRGVGGEGVEVWVEKVWV